MQISNILKNFTDINWINYSPGKPFNLYNNDHANEEQIRRELQILYKAGFRGLGTYGLYNGLEEIPRIAKDIGFEKVISVLWWPNNEIFEKEKDNLKKAIQYLDSILVGNESIHKEDTTFQELKNEIEGLKKLYDIPITTGLHRHEYGYSSKEALELGDYVMYNLQPWWANVRRNPVDGAGWVKGIYDEIIASPHLKGKPVVIHEVAWPCGDNVPEGISKEKSYQNQKIFYQKLLEYKIPFVWSFSCDMDFARLKSPPGGYGGLWTENWEPKPVVSIIPKKL